MYNYSGALLLLLGLLSDPLWAQVPVDNKWEFSGFFGTSHFEDALFETPVEGGDTRTVGLDSATGYVVGARVTENLGQHFGAELEYAYANHPLTFVSLRPNLPSLALDHRVHKLAYSAVFYPLNRRRRIRPFASVGAGASLFQVAEDSRNEALATGVDLKNRWKFAGSWGAGAKVYAGRNWGFRVDFRDHITGVPNFGLPSTAPQFQGRIGVGFRPEGAIHNWQFAVGLMYTFAGR